MPPKRRANARRSSAAALIDRFVPENTPLGRLDEGNVLLRAAGGNAGIAKFLALLARKESSFGAAGRLPKVNNYWGWGIHLGPDVHAAPSVEAMARRIAKGLQGGLYKGAGLVTTDQIINRYAPPSENNTALYQSQVKDWSRQLGLNPNANIFTQGNESAGAPVARDPGAAPSSPSAASGRGAPRSVSFDARALARLLDRTQAQALAGQMPGDDYSAELGKMVQGIRAQLMAPRQQEQRPAAPRDPVRTAQSTGQIALTPHGEWAGTAGPVKALTELATPFGLKVTSAKRSRRNTLSGGVSDHWEGNRTGYAHDIGWGGSRPTAQSDKAASAIVAALGGPANWGKTGGVFNITRNGIRYQVLYRTNVGGDHYNHIHLGARRV